MAIWVDADAVPQVIRGSSTVPPNAARLALTLVANQTIEIPRSRHVRMLTVSAGLRGRQRDRTPGGSRRPGGDIGYPAGGGCDRQARRGGQPTRRTFYPPTISASA